MFLATAASLAAAADALTVATRGGGTVGGAGDDVALATFSLEGTYGTAVVAFEGQLKPSGTWFGINVLNLGTNANLAAGSNSLTDNTSYLFQVQNSSAYYAVRCRLVSISSGSITANCRGANVSEVPTQLPPVIMNSAAVAQTVTSASATALAVGPNGTTNPTFSVNSATANAATGLTVIGAAAAAGVALTVISSGTNENLAVNAKGSGTISLQATATGGITIGSATGRIVTIAGTLTAGGLLGAALQVCTSGPSVYSGSGAPTISAAVKGSLYLRSDGSATNNRAYIATDTAGTWTALTTAA